MPVKLTPNGPGFALKPAAKFRKRAPALAQRCKRVGEQDDEKYSVRCPDIYAVTMHGEEISH